MYVITFYSFKGGVGRTMALANVGLELARKGRNVLLVDFDLEAPGLDTFDVLKPEHQTAGIVDYVTSYRLSGTAPDVSGFIYEPQVPLGIPGHVWVMPTGKQDDQYASRLQSIDWQQLYSEYDGYVLFEDLKAQWRRTLSPDYVLIDSRTGHTDVGGICTRQLPDAVAILFFPNEQNRRGIEVVVRNVRREQQESKREIQLHFIASNVPDLDDEEQILRDRLNHFRRTIDYSRLDGVIHHYDSLSLLQQTVFTVERPLTKLAREYRRLAERLIGSNLGDRRVVLDILARISTGGETFQATTIGEIDTRLKEIYSLYRGDSEVLHSLAKAHQYLGKSEVAENLFLEARSLGFETADVLIERAVASYDAGSAEAARESLKAAVNQSVGQVFKLGHAFTVVLERDIEFLTEFAEVLNSSTIRPIDRIRLSKLLATERRALEAVDRLLTPIIHCAADVADREAAQYDLALCRIAQKRFKEAMKLIAPERALLAEMGIGENFNYAMAEWGATNHVPADLFQQALLIHQKSPRVADANYFQCLAIAHWAVDRIDEARTHVELSRQALREAAKSSKPVFSAWRYLYADEHAFREDLNSLDSMLAGSGEGPRVFR